MNEKCGENKYTGDKYDDDKVDEEDGECDGDGKDNIDEGDMYSHDSN